MKISFKNTLNRSGPRMEPWGIPVIASFQSLNEPFVRILCCLFHKQFCISFKYALEKPHPSNFANSKLPDQCCMIAEDTTYPWPSGQRGKDATTEVPVRFLGWQNTIPPILDIRNLLSKTNGGRGGRPDWAVKCYLCFS